MYTDTHTHTRILMCNEGNNRHYKQHSCFKKILKDLDFLSPLSGFPWMKLVSGWKCS